MRGVMGTAASELDAPAKKLMKVVIVRASAGGTCERLGGKLASFRYNPDTRLPAVSNFTAL